MVRLTNQMSAVRDTTADMTFPPKRSGSRIRTPANDRKPDALSRDIDGVGMGLVRAWIGAEAVMDALLLESADTFPVRRKTA